MLYKSTTLCMLILAVLLCSCTAKKELQTVKMEADELRARNAELTRNVSSLQKDRTEMQKEVLRGKAMEDEYNQYRVKCMKVEERYNAAQSVLDEQSAILHQIEAKLEQALVDFQNKGVEVYYNKGFVFVSMEDNLMYNTGSSKLNENGKKALSNLASVLNEYPKLKVIVLGNTDDVPFKKGTDNWSLSTERANGVVRVLRDLYQVDPSRLTAAGKGKYNPVADNSTAEGRAKNRRTDIILNPDLDRLWETINK
jgi:chemotaxis protein MotB